MDFNTVSASNKLVSGLNEAGGAIGLICGLLLVGMFLFFRYLMESVKTRDAEVASMNKQLQETLIENSAALSSLTNVLQQRSCLSGCNLEQLESEVKPIYLKKKD